MFGSGVVGVSVGTVVSGWAKDLAEGLIGHWDRMRWIELIARDLGLYLRGWMEEEKHRESLIVLWRV